MAIKLHRIITRHRAVAALRRTAMIIAMFRRALAHEIAASGRKGVKP